LDILVCYYKLLSKQQAEESNSYKKLIQQIEPPLLDGDNFKKLLSMVDNTFQSAVRRTYTSFTSPGSSLISKKERDELIAKYKSIMPNHYLTTKKMMGINIKENLSRNEPLKESSFYDK